MTLPTLILLASTARAADEQPAAEQPAAEQPAAEQSSADASTGQDTFGHVLDELEQAVTWSAYADFAMVAPAEGGLTFDASHFNPILGARVSHQLWAELELELEHAGQVVKMEYGFLDWSPSPSFTLRTGRFLVPIGAFNDRLHPSFRWPQLSRPAFARDVVPAVWSDLGVQAMGDLDLATAWTASWSLYVVNGLGGSWEADAPPPLRDLRDNVLDNNVDKALGGRLGLTAVGGLSRVRVDLSGYSGALDDSGGTRLSLADAAAEAELGPVVLRGELAHSWLDDQPWRLGSYAQTTVRIGRVEPALRWDHTLDRDDSSTTDMGVASTRVTLSPLWNLRAEVGVDLAAPTDRPELGLMSAFFF